MDKISEISPKKDKKTWSLRKRDDDGSVEISVKELDGGGFLVCKSKDYKDKDGNYKYETTEYYSEKNPLEPKDEEKELLDTINNVVDGGLASLFKK